MSEVRPGKEGDAIVLSVGHGPMVARDERAPKAADLAAWSKSPRLREGAAFSYPETGSLERADPSRKESTVTAGELKPRRDLPEKDTLIIAKTDRGFRVYSP